MAALQVDGRHSHAAAAMAETALSECTWAGVPGAALSRRLSYALVGAALAQGVAVGLLLLHWPGAAVFPPGGFARELTTDLHTYVYVALSTTVAFAVFGAVIGHYADHLARLASTDPLTGLLNARVFRARLHEEMARATRYRHPLSLLLVDLDGLKRVNDEYGHQAGDAALQHIAVAMRQGLREADVAARVGGDEFALIGPNTSEPAAIVLAERLRLLVAGEPDAGTDRGITVSIGISSLVPGSAEGPSERGLLHAADMALYEAKHRGGNVASVLRPPPAEGEPEIVRPQQHRERALPKRQVQKPNRKQPCGKPQRPREAVLLDSDLLHLTNSLLTRR
jgi:diguanylate cyclase (GGDEF)-like protein